MRKRLRRNGADNTAKYARTRRPATLKRRALVALLATALGITMSATFGASPASASAYTCVFWGPINIPGVGTPIPTGQFCTAVNGTGTWVDNTYGAFLSAGSICNYSMTSEFFDSSSRWYRTWSSGTNWGCTFPGWGSNGMRIYEKSWVQRGFVCNTLRSNGSRITSACFSIY
jgi:hypothetical protein